MTITPFLQSGCASRDQAMTYRDNPMAEKVLEAHRHLEMLTRL